MLNKQFYIRHWLRAALMVSLLMLSGLTHADQQEHPVAALQTIVLNVENMT
jgi:hypothetical protein